jgi:shikimate kinase
MSITSGWINLEKKNDKFLASMLENVYEVWESNDRKRPKIENNKDAMMHLEAARWAGYNQFSVKISKVKDERYVIVYFRQW